MGEPIENLYFNWLCAKVLDGGSSAYEQLMVILHRTEFVWLVPADRRRASEGKNLRDEFLTEANIATDSVWEAEPCSILELLIAFAVRAAFQNEAPLKDWFWEFLHNLRLDEYHRVSKHDQFAIEDILEIFVWRQYEPNGVGGILPVYSSPNDQRKIELWYQLAEYITERGLL
jgi:hypothetical protein